MTIRMVRQGDKFSTTGQISLADLQEIAAAGYQSVICNRPDGEGGARQPSHTELERATAELGLRFAYFPVVAAELTSGRAAEFQRLLATLPEPVLAFCGTGARSAKLYHLAMAVGGIGGASALGKKSYDVIVVGGGAAGIGVTASLLRRNPALSIAIIEPSGKHYYQPAWTLVGGGAFDLEKTVRPMAEVIPAGATWIRAAATALEPEQNSVQLAIGESVKYEQLIVCPGLQLAWDKIEGLVDTLGKNGVTSNYRFDLAPYTWQLVTGLKRGNALFTQPPMPIKCAGAPQKAMYLSCDHWLKRGALNNIQVEFHTAAPALFGVAAFVPALMQYVKKYAVSLSLTSNLVKVDGERKMAWFDVKDANGEVTRQAKSFDMLHVVPPQIPPSVVQRSPLADSAGWCEVNQTTLQHVRYSNVFSLGDVCSAPSAKTAAAVRKQIVVVAENLLAARVGQPLATKYDGYGACPLTVEKGKVVLAEFGYGGKLLPTFRLDPTVPRSSAWFLKTRVLPWIYWNALLKGREWLARPSQP